MEKKIWIWTGISVDRELEWLRGPLRALVSGLGVDDSNLALPFHVSLKMSFPIGADAAPAVIGCIEDYLSDLRPFSMAVAGIELHDVIAWIRMKENTELNRIHDGLDALLSAKFGVAQHEYDKDYLFHTTLIMDGDAEKVRRGYEALRGVALPETLPVRIFLIGTSNSGAPGSYRVVREIDVGDGMRDV